MLLDPYCFIVFLESSDVPILEYIDNWTDGEVHYHFFDEDLVIDMRECIHREVAGMYLRKLRVDHLSALLASLDCPCLDK